MLNEQSSNNSSNNTSSSNKAAPPSRLALGGERPPPDPEMPDETNFDEQAHGVDPQKDIEMLITEHVFFLKVSSVRNCHT